MHLEVTQSGGFGGLTRQWSTYIPDTKCTPLIKALEQADTNVQGHADERMYEIHLGDASATVSERHTHAGPLATLVILAQEGSRAH